MTNNPILKAIANTLILVGGALALLFVTQMADDIILANLEMLWWGMALAIAGGFLKGWMRFT